MPTSTVRARLISIVTGSMPSFLHIIVLSSFFLFFLSSFYYIGIFLIAYISFILVSFK